MPDEVRAAGGVVCRGDRGTREVVVIHRPRYDDWTFPKGKVEPGEHEIDAAVREVCEETGLVCAPAGELPSVAYIDPKGRPKTVRYWRMQVVSGEPEPGDGVDEVRWAAAEEAAALLTHDRDREVLGAV